MAWKLKSKPRVEPITHRLAEKFAKMEPAPGDRHFKTSRAALIKTWVESGQFKKAEWASAQCHADGKMYRINGKHSSAVLSEMNGTLPKGLNAVLEEYECDTLDDVAALYATFDRRASVRSTNDINRSFAACNADLAEVPPYIINRVVTGLAYAEFGHATFIRQPEERAALLNTYGDFVTWCYLLLAGHAKENRHLLRGPVVAAIFRTWKKSQKAAEEFWTLVRDASGPKNTSPDRVLNKYLLTNSVNSGRGAVAGKLRSSADEMYSKCIYAWNAWRRGDTALGVLKYLPKSPAPEAK